MQKTQPKIKKNATLDIFLMQLLLGRTIKHYLCNVKSCKNMEQRRTTPEFITSLEPNEIFLFGSNLRGMHGSGAAYGTRGEEYCVAT